MKQSTYAQVILMNPDGLITYYVIIYLYIDVNVSELGTIHYWN